MALGPRGFGGGGANANITVTTNIQQSLAALNQLQQSFAQIGGKISRSVSNAAQSFGPLDFHLRRINANIVATGFAVAGLAKQTGDFIERGAKMELFSKRMETVSGSVKAAENDMAALIKFTEQVPFKLEETTRSFIKLKTAGIEPLTKDGGGPLKALVDAMAAFGGTSEQLDRATAAIVQMAGKGTISMEELRQQLGEAVPTAIRIFAREMDMTVGKFIKEVSRGKISADNLGKLFLGLEKNYAGSAAKMMNTFIGATQQMDTALDVLAKTIFVDTGTMRYFTAAVQMATDKIKEFDRFLRTAQGQKWIDAVWKGFKQVSIYIADAITPARTALKIIGQISSIVADMTRSLPAEIVGGGLLGYVLFGRAGIGPGVLLGAFGDELSGALGSIKNFLKTTDAAFNLVGGAATYASIGGMIGFRLAGPKGALVGAVGGALYQLLPEIQKFLNQAVNMIDEINDPAPTYPQLEEGQSMSGAKWDELVAKYEKDYAAWLARRNPIKLEIPVKMDLPEIGSEQTLGEKMDGLFLEAEKRAEAGKQRVIGVIDGFSADLVTASQKISDVKIGDYTREFTDKDTAVQQLTEYGNNLETTITTIQDRLSKLYEKKPLAVPGLTIDEGQIGEETAKLENYKVQMERSIVDISRKISDLQQKKSTPVEPVKFDLAAMDQNIASLKQRFDNLQAAKEQAVADLEAAPGANVLLLSTEGIDKEIENVRAKFQQAVDARDAAKKQMEENPVDLNLAPMAIDKEIESLTRQLERVTKARDDTVAKLAQEAPPVDIGINEEQLNSQISALEENLRQAVKLRDDTVANISKISEMPAGGIAGGVGEDLQALRDYVSQLDTSFQSIEQKKATLAEFSEIESQWREKIDNSNLSLEQRNELLNAMGEFHQELADGMILVGEQVDASKEKIDENSKYVQRLNNDITDLQQRANDMTLGESWTGEAERMREAGNSIADVIGDIKLKIEEIREAQEKGLITPESANAAIANLESIAAAVEGSKGRMISAASDISQAWQMMGREIYSAIESALGDAIYNLVTGAKSMKDVLLDLWKSVTRAVSNYIAKLIMASLFGGGGAGGGIFGSIFGSGMNTGGELKFAEGGSAIMDGRTGFDKNMVSMRVSRGERVTVETAAQQKANSRISGGAVYNIYALDGNSVERMLLQHGGVLKTAIDGRTRLNK